MQNTKIVSKVGSNSKNFGNGGRNSTTNAGRNSDYTDLSLDEAIDDFIYARQAENLSDATIEDYEYAFSNFQAFLEDENPKIKELDRFDFRDYLTYLQKKGLSPFTVEYHYRHLNAFFNWIVAEDDYLDSNPLDRVRKPKTPNELPEVLDEDQSRQLLKEAESCVDRWSGQRNYTMLVVFIQMGLRLEELVSAKLSDLDIQDRMLKIKGKGRKERKVSFNPKTSKVLRKWLDRRKEQDNIYDDNIFISEGGEELKERNVQRIVTRIQERAGLGDEKVCPQILRRTSATLAAKNDMRAFQIQQMYGWEQIETALKYIRISGRDVKEAMQNSSPLENF